MKQGLANGRPDGFDRYAVRYIGQQKWIFGLLKGEDQRPWSRVLFDNRKRLVNGQPSYLEQLPDQHVPYGYILEKQLFINTQTNDFLDREKR